MLNSLEFNFLSLMIFKNKSRYFALSIVSIVVVFLLSSTLFISSSIKFSLLSNLKNQPDFVVQKIEAGQSVSAPLNWQDKLLEIPGVSSVNARVYGRYALKNGKSALIVGIDFFDEQTNKTIKELTKDIDLKEFLKTDSMLVGSGLNSYFQKNFFNKNFSFITPSGNFKSIKIYSTLSRDSALFSNDIAIMPINLAKEILGINKNSASDFVLNIPNDSEKATIKDKIESLYFDIKVITKDDIKKAYKGLYDYKSGIFLALFLITLTTFTLILYLRYTIATSIEKKEIGIFRALGWSIKDILKLKFFENLSLVLFAFIVGVSLAYIYVFNFNAPLLINIFLGGDNLEQFANLSVAIDYGVIASIFILFALSFLATTLIPIWRIAITDPKEAML
jgi:ABC-type lipoprotein release transport system permease subunit